MTLRVDGAGRGPAKSGDRLNLELQATPEEVMRAVETLQEFGRKRGISEKVVFGLALSLEESGSNIVNYALKRDAQRKFQVALLFTNDTFVIELRDRGPEFDPTAAGLRKPQADDDDLPGGWGIQLIRRYTDEIQYMRQGDENVLRLTKRRCCAPDDKDSSSANQQPEPKHER